MGIFDWFKRKKQEKEEINIEELMIGIIRDFRRLGWDDERIKNKFIEKNYPEKLVDRVFKIYWMKGGAKMAIKKNRDEEEDLEEGEEEMDEEPEDSEEPEEEKTIVKKKVQAAPNLSISQIITILQNLEARIIAMETRITTAESRLFRAGI